MASFSAEMRVGGRSYPLTNCTFGVQQATHQRGRVSTKVRYELVYLTLDVPDDADLLAWTADARKQLAVEIVFRNAAGGSALETLSLQAAYCVAYREEFVHGDAQRGAYQCLLTLSDPSGFTLQAGGSASTFMAPLAREHGSPPAILLAAVPHALTSQQLLLKRDGSEGVEQASPALIAKVASKRDLHLAQTPDELRYLNFIGAEANVGGEKMDHILIKDPPSKAALLEEFLHGTQYRLGMVRGLGDVAFAEWHVKDFMVRHSRLLGLGAEDTAILATLRDRDYKIWQGIT